MTKNQKKKRLKRIRHHEHVCKMHKRVENAMNSADQSLEGHEFYVSVSRKLTTKVLKFVTANPEDFRSKSELVKTANDELTDRQLKLTQQ